jgi:hypothetical protein
VKPVLLNVATRHFVKGQQRLIESFEHVRNPGQALKCWRNHFPPDSPPQYGHRWPHPHGSAPYAFKVHAIKAALQIDYDRVIWCDASIVPIRPVDPILNYIEEHGYWLVLNGWNVGEWCADSALAPLNITRQESFQIQLCVGGAFALNLDDRRGRDFYEHLLAIPDEAFCGPWTNDNHIASDDPRVRGHRHDQTVMSVIAWKLGMKLIEKPRFFDYGDSVKRLRLDGSALSDETILVADGKY